MTEYPKLSQFHNLISTHEPRIELFMMDDIPPEARTNFANHAWLMAPFLQTLAFRLHHLATLHDNLGIMVTRAKTLYRNQAHALSDTMHQVAMVEQQSELRSKLLEATKKLYQQRMPYEEIHWVHTFFQRDLNDIDLAVFGTKHLIPYEGEMYYITLSGRQATELFLAFRDRLLKKSCDVRTYHALLTIWITTTNEFHQLGHRRNSFADFMISAAESLKKRAISQTITTDIDINDFLVEIS